MSETLSYNAIRTSNQAREADELRAETRRKNLLILVLQYLNDEGFVESAQALSKETNIDLRRFEVCDNVDLHTILMEYESYYYIKFAKYPKVTKKLNQPTTDIKTDNKQKGKGPSLVNRPNHRTQSTPSLPRLAGAANGSDTTPPATSSRQTSAPKNAVAAVSYVNHVLNGNTQQQKSNALAVTNSSNASAGDTQQDSGGLSLHGLTLQSASSADAKGKQKQKAGHIIDVRSMINDATRLNVEEGSSDDRLLKPLGGYVGYNSEWRELAQVVSRDIYLQNPDVRWDDIIGLETPKRLVKESVVYPIKYPQLFTGILSPWKGLLLYGPPGTGKTMLAKAVATECNTTFFNISASTIVSKWRGDSEKLVRVLFELARFHAPSTIFLDELDAIMGQRGSTGNSSEHEGSRRMKTELLMQMDGLAKTDDLVFLLAASNLPWELDHAMLRRLEKRILVDLPERAARKAMFLHHLPPVVNQSKHNNGLELHANLDYDLLAEETNGYSGADVRLVCKEAAMRTVRKVFDALENHVEGDLHITLDEIRTADVLAALSSTKPSASKLQAKYMAWQKEFESA